MELIDRIKAILFAPQSEWPAIERESGEPWVLLSRYVAILALIPAIAHFIGSSLIGWYTPIASGLAGALFEYALAFVQVYIVALTIDLLAPTFDAQKNFPNAFKLAVYAYTPYWLAGIFLLVPGLSFLTILGLYGLYLLWVGLPPLMRAPADQALLYAASVVAVALLLAVALGAIEFVMFGAPR